MVFGLAFVFFFNRGLDFNFFVFDFFAIPVPLKINDLVFNNTLLPRIGKSGAGAKMFAKP